MLHACNKHVCLAIWLLLTIVMLPQVETAAIKAVGANKSAPFERKLTGLYTKATLEVCAQNALSLHITTSGLEEFGAVALHPRYCSSCEA
jgi:hypothetical protein